MNIKSIISKAKETEFWIEECPGTHQVCEWAWIGFTESSKYFDPRFLSFGLYFYNNGFASEVTPRAEKIEQFYYALRKYGKDKSYIGRKTKEWRRKSVKMTSDAWKLLADVKTLKTHQIAEGYKLMADRYIDFGRYSVFGECVDPFTEDVLPKMLDKEFPKLSQGVKAKIAATMSAPMNLSFMEHERIECLTTALGCIKSNKSLDKNVKKLESKYHWILTHYGGAKSKTADTFKEEILALARNNGKKKIAEELKSLLDKHRKLKEEKKKIIKKFKIKRELQKMFSMIAEMGAAMDERKKYAMQMTYIIYKLMPFFASTLKCPKELLPYLTSMELSAWLKSGREPVGKKELEERRKFSVFVVVRKAPGKAEAKFVTGKNARDIRRAVFNHDKVSEFKGTVASAPVKILKGEASVVLNSHKDKFKSGNILVTTMTRPDFLPLMRKAKAIITDEGGLTCHAAIVSREMGIPCIIGTRIATRSIKSGDKVQMDLQEGMVKVLK